MNLGTRELPVLTTLRFFAAAVVLGFHFWPGGQGPAWFGEFFQNGYESVAFFFVLSGFILTHVYSSRVFSRREFWLSRLARIYPVYLVSLVIALPVLVYGAFVSRPVVITHFWLAMFVVSVLLQSWIPQTALIWNDPAWSLSVEAFFYALFPDVLRLQRFVRPLLILGFATTLVVLTEIARPAAVAAWVEERGNLLHRFLAFFPLFQLPQLLFGMALGLFSVSGRSFEAWFAELVLAAGLGGIALVFVFRTNVPDLIRGAALVLLYGSVVFAGTTSVGIITRILSHGLLVRLGEASYAMNILHIPLQFWWNKILRLMTVDRSSVALFLGFLAWLVVLSRASHRFVETRSRSLILARYGKRSTV